MDNHILGNVHSALQAGQIHGDVHMHAAAQVTLVPHLVPAAPGRFVNRVDELARMGELLGTPDRTGIRVMVLTGHPGVGKTATARRAVQLCGGVYPGGELYVDFADLAEDPETSVADALAECLRALGVADAQQPATLADRARLLRRQMGGRALLMMLDNVTEHAQVGPLTPNGPGSAVLVVSNRKLAELRLDGAESMELLPLTGERGAHYLAELSGRDQSVEPDAVAGLVELCDGLPVALGAMAALLHVKPRMPVADLVTKVADERSGLRGFTVGSRTDVSAVLTVASAALPDDVRRLYRRLGLLPGPTFTVQRASAADGTDLAAAMSRLDVLAEANMITEEADGRFRLHGVVRRHARELAEDGEPLDDRLEVQRRALHDLLLTAAFADRKTLGTGRLRCTPHDRLLSSREDPFSDKRQALDWLEAERMNLLGGVRQAAEHGWHELTWQLAETATALYVAHRYYDDWTETSDLGSVAAGLAGDAVAEARLRSFVSRPWTELGELTRAGQELDQALGVLDRVADTRLSASVWEMVARHRDRTDPDRANEAYKRAIALFSGIGDERGVSFVTYFHGASQHARGQLAAARETLTHAVKSIDESRMLGRALTSLGVVLTELGEYEQARAELVRAVELLSGGGFQHYEQVAREALAKLDDLTGRGAEG